MSTSQDYRGFAARCLEIERRSADVQTQALMLQMAQICQRLAEELDAADQDKRPGTTKPARRDPAPTLPEPESGNALGLLRAGARGIASARQSIFAICSAIALCPLLLSCLARRRHSSAN